MTRMSTHVQVLPPKRQFIFLYLLFSGYNTSYAERGEGVTKNDSKPAKVKSQIGKKYRRLCLRGEKSKIFSAKSESIKLKDPHNSAEKIKGQ